VSSRKLFVLLHMVGVAADERVTTDERFYQQLCVPAVRSPERKETQENKP
jgi:hypothetical protein